MAALQYEAFAHKSATTGNDPLVDKPTGTADGDTLIAVAVSTGGGADPVAPAGWTKHANSVNDTCPLWTRTASGEGANYSWVVGGLGSSNVVIVRVSGALAVEAVSGVAGTGNLVIPAATSGGANRLALQIVTKQNNTTFTGPGSQTERFDAVSSSQSYVSAGGDEVVGSGSTGTRTWVPGSGSNNGVGYLILLTPRDLSGGASTTTATVSLSASGEVGAGGAGTSTVTATLSSAGTMGRQGDGARSASVTLSASGATNVTGVASLGVVGTRSADGAGAGVAEGIETVQLGGSGSTGVDSGASGTFTVNRSATAALSTYGGGTRGVTVTASASGIPGADATRTVTVGLGATSSPGANGPLGAVVTLTASANVATSATASLSVTASTGGSGSRGFGSGASLTLSASTDGSLLKRYHFTPPTQDQSMPDWFWGRFDTPVGISVVKQGGHYVLLPTPTNDELEAAGTEGTDWFRGGYTYEISDAVDTALRADGLL